MNIRPFAAVRPQPQFASAVAAVPYDVVDTAEARALANGFRVDPASLQMEVVSDIGYGSFADSVVNATYDSQGLEAPDALEGQAIYLELNAGWKTDAMSAVVTGLFTAVL